MTRLVLTIILVTAGLLCGAPLPIRVVAANLTSDNHQTYSPDNTTHSNPEGAGARILKGLNPDVVLIQEFTTTIPTRQWVNQTFGSEFDFAREENKQLPNGIISRFKIASSGSWEDRVVGNRGFSWARLQLPGQRDLWVVSVHLHAKGATSRTEQAKALAKFTRRKIPDGAFLIIGGDLNTRATDEECFHHLARVVSIPPNPPADADGIIHTNAPRNRPYDWVLASPELDRHAVPVELAGQRFTHGLVFDSRVFEPLEKVPPVQRGDSGLRFMQHMAVVRDFRIP